MNPDYGGGGDGRIGGGRGYRGGAGGGGGSKSRGKKRELSGKARGNERLAQLSEATLEKLCNILWHQMKKMKMEDSDAFPKFIADMERRNLCQTYGIKEKSSYAHAAIPFEQFIFIFTDIDNVEYVLLRGAREQKTARRFMIAEQKWVDLGKGGVKEFSPAAGQPMPSDADELLNLFKQQIYGCISAKKEEIEAALKKFDSKKVATRRLAELLQHEQQQNSGNDVPDLHVENLETRVARLQEENKDQQVKISNLESALASAKKRIEAVGEENSSQQSQLEVCRGEIAELRKNLKIARSELNARLKEENARLKEEEKRLRTLLGQREQE